MCYSISLKRTKKELEKYYGLAMNPGQEILFQNFVSGFDFPSFPVIQSAADSGWMLASWGLIPHWIKDKKEAIKIKTYCLNARGETIFNLPSFKKAAAQSRCIVPVSGFFEWMGFSGQKYPHFIYPVKEAFFSLGGLLDFWLNHEDGELISTFAIVTTPANPLMERIHNSKKRMPLIFNKENAFRWLDKATSLEEIREMIVPAKTECMNAYTIGRNFNQKPVNQDAEIVKVDYPELAMLDD